MRYQRCRRSTGYGLNQSDPEISIDLIASPTRVIPLSSPDTVPDDERLDLSRIDCSPTSTGQRKGEREVGWLLSGKLGFRAGPEEERKLRDAKEAPASLRTEIGCRRNRPAGESLPPLPRLVAYFHLMSLPDCRLCPPGDIARTIHLGTVSSAIRAAL